MIAPGQEVTVTLRIRYVQQMKKPAASLNEQGEKLLFSRRSSISLMNLVPAERRQSENDLRRAAALFEQALAEDATFALAGLSTWARSTSCCRTTTRAPRTSAAPSPSIPTLVEARAQYAAHAHRAGRPRRGHPPAHRGPAARRRERRGPRDAGARLLGQGRVGAGRSRQADQAIALRPSNAQAHLWKADALRQTGGGRRTTPTRSGSLYAAARDDYRAFLDLTNFSSGLGARLAFHFIGLGRRQPARTRTARGVRQPAQRGLPRALPDRSRRSATRCARGSTASARCATRPTTRSAYFLLGNIHRDLWNERQSCDDLAAARASYQRMIALNPHLEESRNARGYLAQIDALVPLAGCGEAHRRSHDTRRDREGCGLDRGSRPGGCA